MIAWMEDLKRRGVMLAGQPLAPDGGVVASSKDTIVDGPFVESKEAVGGYIVVRAESLHDAKEVAKACPVLKYGLVIEVRPTVGRCPLAEELDVDMVSVVGRG